MKLYCFSVVLVLASFLVHGQEIIVQGNVSNAITHRGVKAKITYKSYPTGGISGTIQDSTFSFSIFGSSKYMVMAEAEGFIPMTVLVDPKEKRTGNTITRDIALTSKGGTVRINNLIFEMGRAVINPKSYNSLDEVAAMMKTNTSIVIQMEGHTDNQGNAAANLKLSQDRVDAVKKYIVGKGVSKDRIKTKAFGGTQPLSNEKTEEARSLNRRVEMRVLKD